MGTSSWLTVFSLILNILCPAIIYVNSASVEEKFSCPHGWTRYGAKKCLKYVNELQDYERAQAACRSKNQGSLVSIHSQEEQNFVYSYIHSIAASSTPIWLGAKQIDFESILWLDKTENSFTNWAPSEPSHQEPFRLASLDPDEICIAINPRNGQWHDVMCSEANIPACERAPTTQWPFFVAFCSEGWFQFNDEKCVRIIGSQALNFYESQELCRSKYNSKLLSIKSDKESEFLHNLIKFKDIKLPVWLGAVQNDLSSFNWLDKSDVTFTNWADSEPNDPDHGCISMVSSNGKWSDNDCKEQKLILCQKIVPDDSSCETGWLQFRQDKCYRFVHVRLAYEDAESLCNSLYGGHLPSIHSQEEQFMLSQFLASVNVKNGSEIWLGGRQMDMHNFNWADGSLFNYTFWEHGEPNFPTEKCIEMSWRNGRWNDINCKLKRAVLCERQLPLRMAMNKPILYQPASCLVESNCSSSFINPMLQATYIGHNGSYLTGNELSLAQASQSQFELNVSSPAPVTTTINSASGSSTSVVNSTTTTTSPLIPARQSTTRSSVFEVTSNDQQSTTTTTSTSTSSTTTSTTRKPSIGPLEQQQQLIRDITTDEPIRPIVIGIRERIHHVSFDPIPSTVSQPELGGGGGGDAIIKITDLGTDSPLTSRQETPTTSDKPVLATSLPATSPLSFNQTSIEDSKIVEPKTQILTLQKQVNESTSQDSYRKLDVTLSSLITSTMSSNSTSALPLNLTTVNQTIESTNSTSNP